MGYVDMWKAEFGDAARGKDGHVRSAKEIREQDPALADRMAAFLRAHGDEFVAEISGRVVARQRKA